MDAGERDAELALRFGLAAAVAAPIVVAGEVWGMLTATSDAHPLPAGTRIHLQQIFAQLVAAALANAQAQAELQTLADEQAALRRAAEVVARSPSIEEVFTAVATEASRLLGGPVHRTPPPRPRWVRDEDITTCGSVPTSNTWQWRCAAVRCIRKIAFFFLVFTFVLLDGSPVCWSGYYHGILERAFSGVSTEDMPAVARRLCASAVVRRNDFTAYQCVHGLGHGLMIYTGYDLPLALATCDKLATSWDQTSCTGGVFMENLQTSYGTTSQWLKDDNPLYPCTIVSEPHKLYCYLMVTSRILDVDGGDWAKTVAWCRKSEPNWVATCFQSLGRDASGRSLQSPKEILRICALAGDEANQCGYGAARDITSMDAGARRSAGFCARAPATWRSYCFNGIGTILGGFSRDAGTRRASCREAVPKQYWKDCFIGAGA